MKFNFHTHSTYSDGKNTIEELTKEAIRLDFDIVGISDHGYVPFPSDWNAAEITIDKYFKEIDDIEQKYLGKIKLLKGVEADFVEGVCNIDIYKKYNFDYIIGSVHYFPFKFENGYYFNFDTTEKMFLEGLKLFFDNNIPKMIERYYENVMEMIQTSTPTIVGHLDIIGKFNFNQKYFNQNSPKYLKLVDKVLDTIKNKNVIMEINARRKYKNFHLDVSPAQNIIQMALKKDIPITISGDVHAKEDFGKYWEDTLSLVQKIGYNQIVFHNGLKWENYKI